MSARALTLTVVLDSDYRVDDLEASILPAIRQMRGVAPVAANITGIEDYMAVERARAELGMKVIDLIRSDWRSKR